MLFSRNKPASDALHTQPIAESTAPIAQPPAIPQTKEGRIRSAFLNAKKAERGTGQDDWFNAKKAKTGEVLVREFEGARAIGICFYALKESRVELSDSLFQLFSELPADTNWLKRFDVEFNGITLILVAPANGLASVKSISVSDDMRERPWSYKYLIAQDTKTGAGYVAIVHGEMGGAEHRYILPDLKRALNTPNRLCPLGGGQMELSEDKSSMEIFGTSASYGWGNHAAVRDLMLESLSISR